MEPITGTPARGIDRPLRTTPEATERMTVMARLTSARQRLYHMIDTHAKHEDMIGVSTPSNGQVAPKAPSETVLSVLNDIEVALEVLEQKSLRILNELC